MSVYSACLSTGFKPESAYFQNAGLSVARDILEEKIHKKYPELSHGDLWTLAGICAIQEAGGPQIPWRPGRTDQPDGKQCTPDGRLPDAEKGPDHARDIFYRMVRASEECQQGCLLTVD